MPAQERHSFVQAWTQLSRSLLHLDLQEPPPPPVLHWSLQVVSVDWHVALHVVDVAAHVGAVAQAASVTVAASVTTVPLSVDDLDPSFVELSVEPSAELGTTSPVA
jgi:hypothetical protein